jgi:hypothetical protein
MDERIEDERSMKQYLLGNLPEVEQLRIEERLLTDDDYYRTLLILEDELTDDYIKGSLSNQERKRFEEHFLSSPERRQKLKFASALKRYVSETAVAEAPSSSVRAPERSSSWLKSLLSFFQPQSPAFGLAAAAVMLMMAAGLIWLASETSRLRGELDQARNAQVRPEGSEDLERKLAEEHARNEELARQLDLEKGQRSEAEKELAKLKEPAPQERSSNLPGIASFILMPGMVRDTDGPASIKLPPNAEQVRLELSLEQDDYKSYRIELRSDEEKEILRRDNLKPQQAGAGRSVVFKFPSELLKQSSYRIILSGKNESGDYERAGSYFFTVKR